MNRATIEIARRWEGKAMQTTRARPDRSAAALLGYTLDLLPEEGGLAAIVARALAQGLVEQGTVAGRWFDENIAGFVDVELWPPPPRNLLQRLMDRARNTWPCPVVTTRSPTVVVELLDRGWDMQYQLLLVLDADGGGTAGMAEAVRTLGTRRDWRDFSFPEPVRALVAPGADGDWIMVAAADEERLEGVLGTLLGSFGAAGFTVSPSQTASF